MDLIDNPIVDAYSRIGLVIALYVENNVSLGLLHLKRQFLECGVYLLAV